MEVKKKLKKRMSLYALKKYSLPYVQWTDGWMDQWLDRPTYGLTMFLSDTDVIDATVGNEDNFLTDLAIFTEALRTDRSTD